MENAQAVECIVALFVALMGFPMLMFWQALRPPSNLRYWLEWSAFFGAASAAFAIILAQSWRGAFAVLVGPAAAGAMVLRSSVWSLADRIAGSAARPSESPRPPEP
jgi:hypothetical protein